MGGRERLRGRKREKKERERQRKRVSGRKRENKKREWERERVEREKKGGGRERKRANERKREKRERLDPYLVSGERIGKEQGSRMLCRSDWRPDGKRQKRKKGDCVSEKHEKSTSSLGSKQMLIQLCTYNAVNERHVESKDERCKNKAPASLVVVSSQGRMACWKTMSGCVAVEKPPEFSCYQWSYSYSRRGAACFSHRLLSGTLHVQSCYGLFNARSKATRSFVIRG